MTHDASFVDNRLRLTAFLRVMEQGMPHRPSRFKRHVQVSDEAANLASIASISRTNPVLPVSEAHNEPSSAGSASPNASRSLHAAIEYGAAASVDIGQFEVDQAENYVQSASVYDIPRSPTPAEPHSSPTGNAERDARERPSPVQRSSDANSPGKFKRKAEIAVPVKNKKASGKPGGTSGTRKRRLPVNELALLRTTTSDGLPQPSDADVAFAIPITAVDPIEDSQIQNPLEAISPNVQMTYNVMISKRRLSPRMVQQPRADGRKALMKSATRFKERHLGPFKTIPQSRTGIQVAPDGFVGHELQYTSKKGSGRRSKIVPTRKNKPIVVRELALGNGLLPVSQTEESGISMTPVDDNSLYPDRLGNHQHNVKPGQLTLTCSQIVIQDEPSSQSLPEQRDSAILHQLSSITAPLRRDSDSSESDTVADEGNMDFEDGHDTDNTDEADDYDASCVLSTQMPTFGNNTSYFKTAVQHLGVEGPVEHGEDDFWSQYGPMD